MSETFGFSQPVANEILDAVDTVQDFLGRPSRGKVPQTVGLPVSKQTVWINVTSTTKVNGFYPGSWSSRDTTAATWTDNASVYVDTPNAETLTTGRYYCERSGTHSNGTPIYEAIPTLSGVDTDFWTGYENYVELFNTGSVTRYYPGGAVKGFVPTTLALVANQLYFVPFVAAYWDSGQTINAGSIAIAVTTAVAGSHVRLGVFAAKYVSPLTGTTPTLLFQSASLSTAATGLISAAIGSGVVPINTPSAFFLALVADQAITVSAINGTDCYPIGGMDNTLTAAPVVGTRNTFAFGALSAPWSFQSAGQTLIDANGKLPLIALRF